MLSVHQSQRLEHLLHTLSHSGLCPLLLLYFLSHTSVRKPSGEGVLWQMASGRWEEEEVVQCALTNSYHHLRSSTGRTGRMGVVTVSVLFQVYFPHGGYNFSRIRLINARIKMKHCASCQCQNHCVNKTARGLIHPAWPLCTYVANCSFILKETKTKFPWFCFTHICGTHTHFHTGW